MHRMLQWPIVLGLMLCLNAGQGRVALEPPAGPAGTAALRPSLVPATRRDLALAYLRFERALAAHPPGPGAVAGINTRFDQASLAFFSGRYSSAVQTLAAMSRELEGREVGLAGLVVESMRVTSAHAVLCAANKDSAAFELAPMFGVEGADAAVRLQLVLLDAGGAVAWSAGVTSEVRGGRAEAAQVDLGAELATMPRGDFVVALEADGYRVEKGRVTIRESSLEEVRETVLAELAGVEERWPGVARAAASVRARARLLQDEATASESSRFLAGLDGLASAVVAESAMVNAGKNPFASRAGDSWRVVMVGEVAVPCRVYVPTAVARAGAAAPLLVAYHGAGGDESMFFEGYGAGAIKAIADRRGLIVVCPYTNAGASAKAFDRIVDDLAGDYAVDRARVYALGHSMGAGVVAGLASSRGGKIAAACCIAGGVLGPVNTGERKAPTLMIAGELDPLMPVARARRAAERIKPPDEFVEAAGWGHTLVVGSHLERAVEWLVGKRLE